MDIDQLLKESRDKAEESLNAIEQGAVNRAFGLLITSHVQLLTAVRQMEARHDDEQMQAKGEDL